MAVSLSKNKKREAREINDLREKLFVECTELRNLLHRREKLQEFLKTPASTFSARVPGADAPVPKTAPAEFADIDPQLYKHLMKLVESICKQSKEVEKRLYNLENELLEVVKQLLVAAETPGARSKAPVLESSDCPIDIYNETNGAKIDDGVGALKDVDLDIERGPGRRARGTAVFSLLNI